jgi:tetratricopeptide (TPR) repeat protein
VGALGIMVLLFEWLSATAMAAELTARVDRERLSLGESLQLVVALDSDQGGLSTPDLDFDFGDDFDVEGRASSHNMQWINGRTSLSTTVTYRLRPTRAGDLTIPALTLDYRGAHLTTEPISVTVTALPAPQPPPRTAAGGAPDAAQAEPLFLVMDLSKESVVVGEPLTASLYLYTRLDLRDVDFVTPPDFPGFWVDELASPHSLRLERTEWGGVPYHRALLLSRLITPNTAGTVTIPAVVMDASYTPPRRARGNDPFSLFFTRPTVQRIATAPATLTVRPLPDAGKPAQFAGAVGRFQLAATIDPEQTTVGEPIKLVLTVQGTGNFRGLAAPPLALPDGLGAFDTQEECKLTPTAEGSRGQCTYTYLIVPRRAGSFTLPSLDLSYYEPASARYLTLSTPPFTFAAAPGEGGGGPTAVGRRGVELLRKEIHYLMADDTLRGPAAVPWPERPAFWVGVALPPAAYLLWGVLVLTLRLAGRESATGRRRRAYRAALAALSHGNDDPKGVRRILEELFSVLTGRQARGLRRGELAAALAADGHDPVVVEELLAVLDGCDEVDFTPGGGDGAALARRACRGVERLAGGRAAAAGVSSAAVAVGLAAALLGGAAPLLAATDPIVAARQAYAAGEYGRAFDDYRALLGEGENAPLHYNAGCAAYQDGRLGEAIYHWSRALYLDPRLADAAANLETARLAAVDAVAEGDLPNLSWLATHLNLLAGGAAAATARCSRPSYSSARASPRAPCCVSATASTGPSPSPSS